MSLKRFFNRLRLGHAALNTPGLEGETYLTRAVKMGDVKMVEEFLNLGADPDAKNAKGEYPTHIALVAENLNILYTLLNTGANVFLKQENLTLSEHAEKLGKKAIALSLRELEDRRIAANIAAATSMPMGICALPIVPHVPDPRKKPQTPKPPTT